MPSSVASLLKRAGLTHAGAVGWGERIPVDAPGVYLVSLQKLPSRKGGGACPVDTKACSRLLRARPELRLDDRRPTAKALADRIAAFWLEDEPTLYIGLAGSSLSQRVGDYYGTKLGGRAPHAGGWFLKTLSCVPELWVHFAESDDPKLTEGKLLAAFAAGVRKKSRDQLHDPERAMPFANLEYPQGIRKAHGISGATEPRKVKRARPAAKRTRATAAAPTFKGAVVPHARTQRVTDNDLAQGIIRIPVSSKAVFPATRGKVKVELRRRKLTCSWNPNEGEKSRSGRLGVGKPTLSELVKPGEILRVSRRSGLIVLS